MFKNVSELHRALLENEPGTFVSHYILEPVPFAFNQDLGRWVEWKRRLSSEIDVDPKDIVVTGSAAVGFSLNPHKNYRRFGTKSDIDCGIISGHYFDAAWRYLRQLRVSWLSLPRASREAIEDHRKRHVFEGTIAADRMLSLLPFGAGWQKALDTTSKISPSNGREVKLRIYKDYNCLRYYQSRGIEKLRNLLLEESRSDAGVDDIRVVDEG